MKSEVNFVLFRFVVKIKLYKFTFLMQEQSNQNDLQVAKDES